MPSHMQSRASMVVKGTYNKTMMMILDNNKERRETKLIMLQ